MQVIERHLPESCYGQRRKDTSPFITPAGICVHYISDRWGHYGDDPYDVESVLSILREYGLSYHALIDHDRTLYELVPVYPKAYRAFHAGKSEWHGRPDCNDFMLGVALMGMHDDTFTDGQYDTLAEWTGRMVTRFRTIRPENLAGHEHVAPGRKKDPGPNFDWNRYRNAVAGLWEPR